MSASQDRFNHEADNGMHDGLRDMVEECAAWHCMEPGVDMVRKWITNIYGGTVYTDNAIEWMIERQFATRWM